MQPRACNLVHVPLHVPLNQDLPRACRTCCCSFGTFARTEAALGEIVRLAAAIGASSGASLGSGAAEALDAEQQAEWALAALDFSEHPAFWVLAMAQDEGGGDGSGGSGDGGKRVAAGTSDGYTFVFTSPDVATRASH